MQLYVVRSLLFLVFLLFIFYFLITGGRLSC